VKVFVIMPFDDELTAVYKRFLKPTLEQAGFEVHRADDIRNQRNILQDIVEGLAQADLIVADLTGGNENVFYEVGLAHAMNRPVLLLTQDISDVPFDLQSYRLIRYSTHFAEIDSAAQALREYADGVKDGSTLFGNPLVDFLTHSPRERGSLLPAVSAEADAMPVGRPGDWESTDDRGFLDHVADVEEGYAVLREILESVGDQTERIGGITRNRTSDFQSSDSATRSRKIARSLGEDLTTYAQLLSEANARYLDTSKGISNSLEFMLNFIGQAARETPEQGREAVQQQLDALTPMMEAAVGGRDSFSELAEIMEATPRLERHLSRSIREAAREVEKLAANIDQTIASVSRAIQLGNKLLEELDGTASLAPGAER